MYEKEQYQVTPDKKVFVGPRDVEITAVESMVIDE